MVAVLGESVSGWMCTGSGRKPFKCEKSAVSGGGGGGVWFVVEEGAAAVREKRFVVGLVSASFARLRLLLDAFAGLVVAPTTAAVLVRFMEVLTRQVREQQKCQQSDTAMWLLPAGCSSTVNAVKRDQTRNQRRWQKRAG